MNLTLSHGGDLVLDGQHQFGLPGQVLAAALLVLQGDGDAARQVVHAADDGRVRVRLQRAKTEEEVLETLSFVRNMSYLYNLIITYDVLHF